MPNCSGTRVACKMTMITAGSPRDESVQMADTAAYRSTRKYRLLAATNFKFVAIGVFEEEGVVTRAVSPANFWPLELFPASVAHELCNRIHFLPRVRPKRDACAIRFVVSIWAKAKEFRRLSADGGIKSMEESTGLFVNESKLWQKSSIEPFRRFHVCHTQIDVIEATRFHVQASTAWRGTSNACDRER